MKNFIYTIALCAFAALLFSCSSDSTAVEAIGTDLYISGSKNNHACYWKNSQFVPLSDIGFTNSTADSIIVENNNVHLLGHGYNDLHTKSLYWKNGVMANLTDDFSTATELVVAIKSMEVSNGDVYFAGVTRNTAVTPNTYDLVYWKNGIKNIVSTFSVEYFSYHIGIRVINNEVYITSRKEIDGVLTEGYYVNGAFTASPNTILIGCASFNDAAYVFGRENENRGYYKNISTNTEASFETEAAIHHMSFDAGNIYSADAENIYKNGILVYSVPVPENFNGYYLLSGFEVYNGSMHVLTQDMDINTGLVNHRLWIDGEEIMHNENGETFKSIYVVGN